MKAIMYHYVRPDDPSFPYLRYLNLDDFKKQLCYFSKEYHFLSNEDIIEAINCGKSPKGIILTFDDGLKDHYRYVLPELQRRGLWGIFYIPTYPYLTGKLLNVHRIHLLLGKFGGKTVFNYMNKIITKGMLSDVHVQEYQHATYNSQTNDEYTNHVKRTLNYFMSYDYQDKVLDELMLYFFQDENFLIEEFYMTRDEISQLSRAGMIIGSHSYSHSVMSKLPISDQKKEIESSFEFLKSISSNFKYKTFSYPYGGFHSFSDATESFLDEYGCLFSFNVEARNIDSNDLLNRRQALPRYDCNVFPYGSAKSNINKTLLTTGT